VVGLASFSADKLPFLTPCFGVRCADRNCHGISVWCLTEQQLRTDMLGFTVLGMKQLCSLLILTSCALLDVLMILSIISSGGRLLLLPDYLQKNFL
jgi:hypothetical protein